MTYPPVAAAAPQTTRFKDNKGRSWSADVDIVTVRAIRKQLGVDLMDLLHGRHDALKRLIENPETLVDALWLVCQEQCEAAGVSPEQFGRGLYGEAIDDAVDAFLVGLAHFFPRGQREIVLKMLAKIEDVQAKMLAKVLATMDGEQITAGIERDMDAAIAKLLAETIPSTGGESSPS